MVHAVADAVSIAGAQVARSTLRGIQVASAQSGVSFQYLLAKAAQESSFDADAGAKTSSAKGLFQFTRGTWLEVMKRHGADLGLADVSERIMASPSGQLRILDKAAEDKILNLRTDPEVSALAAAAYARDNADQLTADIGRSPDAADLYLAHFLGAKGAGAMLNAAEDAPNIYAAHIAPAAARANPAVFYGPSGAPRTVGDVVELIRGRFENQLERVSDVAAAMAGDDASRAIETDRSTQRAEATAPATADRTKPSGRPPMFDFKDAVAKTDVNRMALNWFLLEELAKMIAQQPLTMADDEAVNDTALPATGFGGDWTSALTNSYLDDADLTAASAARVSRAYTHLQPRR